MKYVYEFIGTFFLVFTIGMVALDPGGAGQFAPLAIGSILAVMVFAGGHISGGMYNPAVALAVFVRGKLALNDMIIYWIVQIVGALIAAFLALYLKGGPTVTAMTLNPIYALIAEFLFTFALCYVVLNTATAQGTAGNSFYGWAIGFTVLVGAYAVGPISAAAFNTAVAVGVSFMGVVGWTNIWIYVAAQAAGAVAAALVFKQAHPRE